MQPMSFDPRHLIAKVKVHRENASDNSSKERQKWASVPRDTSYSQLSHVRFFLVRRKPLRPALRWATYGPRIV